MLRTSRLLLRTGLIGSTALTILGMPDDQFKALIASLFSGALTSILSSIVSGLVYGWFGIPTV